MKTRSITAIFIAAIYVATILLSVYVNKIFFDVFVVAVAVGGSMEICKAIKKKFSPAVDLFVVLYVFLGYIAFFFFERYVGEGVGIAGYLGTLVLVGAICFIYCGASKSKTRYNAFSTLLAMIYPATLLSYMLAVNYLPESYRVNAILLVFLISVLTDTFAYLVGSLIKGPKLCPKISPKKTVSGAIGGLLGGIGGAMIVYALAKFGVFHCQLFSNGAILNVVHFLMIGLFGSVLNQIGDLVASYFKRRCDIKDYGSFLPGHGGVLDRVDGMMFSAVLVYIYITFLVF